MVVLRTGNHGQFVIIRGIDQPVNIVDAPRPVARQIAHQRLGLVNTIERVTAMSASLTTPSITAFKPFRASV